MKPLREHFETETDAGTALRTFDYIDALEKYNEQLSQQLKQQEEVIRELTEVLSHYFDLGYIHGMGYTGKNRIESILEKAKSLTTKDK